MERTIQALTALPKGIFAADESTATIERRFAEAGIDCSEENRRRYRQLFFATPGIERSLSGVILYDETVNQTDDNGTPFVQLLRARGIVPGIKVDTGISPLPGFKGEGVTTGLDDLAKRLRHYKHLGLQFAKWRSAFYIQNNALPSDAAIAANVHGLARFAMECQAADIVPIVEPELIHTGNHSAQQAEAATARILDALFDELALFRVQRQALLLKTSMVLAGSEAPATPAREVAARTLRMLSNHTPHDLGGIVFLSGGQSPEQATANLAAISAHGPQAWPLTFSYARALQQPAISLWHGEDSRVHAAQQAFLARLGANTAAVSPQVHKRAPQQHIHQGATAQQLHTQTIQAHAQRRITHQPQPLLPGRGRPLRHQVAPRHATPAATPQPTPTIAQLPARIPQSSRPHYIHHGYEEVAL